MTHADLTVERWQDLDDHDAAALAAAIARDNDVDPVDLRVVHYAGRTRRVAEFDRSGTRFVLVPGGRGRLGYDGACFAPSPEQTADFAESAEEFDLPPIGEFVDAMTSPSREVDLPALLVAVRAAESGVEPLAPDDPRVTDVVAGYEGSRRGGGLEHVGPDGRVRVRFDDTGAIHAAASVRTVSWEQAGRDLAALGARMSGPDEWEWACGAGATTLFRWGDGTPADGYPYDHAEGSHRTPNLWGLEIGQDPYRHEFTSTPGIVCGGDGGGATCGGAGFFLGWLTLATSYRDTEFGAWSMREEGVTDLLSRPVIDLR